MPEGLARGFLGNQLKQLKSLNFRRQRYVKHSISLEFYIISICRFAAFQYKPTLCHLSHPHILANTSSKGERCFVLKYRDTNGWVEMK